MVRSRKDRKLRNLGTVFNIYCEGETEKYYLIEYVKMMVGYLPRNIQIKKSRNTDAKGIVEDFIKEVLPSSKKQDVFWVIFDIDGQEKQVSKRQKLNSAFQKANGKNINISFSNVCFEYWILLHFLESSKSFYNCEEIEKMIDTKINYSKGGKIPFDLLSNNIESAKKRAAKCREVARKTKNNSEKGYDINPYTNVDEILDSIDQFFLKGKPTK